MKAAQQAPTPIRLKDELKVWLRHQAVDNRRSLSGEIAFRLEQSRRDQEARNANAG